LFGFGIHDEVVDVVVDDDSGGKEQAELGVAVHLLFYSFRPSFHAQDRSTLPALLVD